MGVRSNATSAKTDASGSATFVGTPTEKSNLPSTLTPEITGSPSIEISLFYVVFTINPWRRVVSSFSVPLLYGLLHVFYGLS